LSSPKQLTRALLNPLTNRALKPAFPSRWRSIGAVVVAIARLGARRDIMAGMTILTLVTYLWNVGKSVDLPLYDESFYLSRAVHLLRGDFASANLGDPNASPLYVLIYAGWYALLRSHAVYPWILSSGIVVIGLGCYLLLSRLLHPVLSWSLAIFAVVTTTPIVLGNALYYFAAGVLWMALSLIGKRVYARGLAACLVLVTVYLRPEFLAVLVVMLLGLLIYEYREWTRDQVLWGSVVISYAPVMIGLIFTWRAMTNTLGGAYDRVTSALPWSYNDFYRVRFPDRFLGIEGYAHPWVQFEQDFGHVGQHTLSAALLAMLGNPAKLASYLTFETQRLVASFGTTTFYAAGWRNTGLTSLPIVMSFQTTVLFPGVVVLFAGVALACGWSLRGTPRMPRLASHSAPALIGVVSLVGLLPSLILINPHQRFFMIYPLLLLGVGFGLLCIIARVPTLAGQVWLLPALALALILVLPQPFTGSSARPVMRTVAFLRAYLPNGAVVIGEPADSYSNYLDAEGFHVQGLQVAQYGDPVLLNALKEHPTLGYALLTSSFSDDTYQRWFSEWNAAIPDVHWSQVAAQPDLGLRLFALPVTTGNLRRLSYSNFLRRAQALGGAPGADPVFTTVDFSPELTWQSASARNDVRPALQLVGGTEVSAIQMHPPYLGMPASVASQVSAPLASDLAGRSLLFATSLTPWANARASGGVRLTFTITGTTYSRTYEVTVQNPERWQLVTVPLPRYTGTARLTLTITPRASVDNCATFVGFIGVL
jgi:hypothetical protein